MALAANEVGRASHLGTVTEHAIGRLALRGMTVGDVNEAIRSARSAGRVLTTVGKYGTIQNEYRGLNGIVVVVELEGRNAGRIVTAYRLGAGR